MHTLMVLAGGFLLLGLCLLAGKLLRGSGAIADAAKYFISPVARCRRPPPRSCAHGALRTRAKHIGDVQASDAKAAEAEAVAEFKLKDEQRRWLVVQQRDQ
jgi:hypothetical protein